MKKSIERFQKRYFGETVTTDIKTFNGIQLIAVVAFIVAMVLILIFFPTQKALLDAFCAAVFSFFTMYEANRTGKYERCTIIMSCALNLVFLPILFFEYGKASYCIPIYFIFGVLYNFMLLNVGKAIILTSLNMFLYLIVLYMGEINYVPGYLTNSENIKDYMAILIGIFFTAICGGIAIKYRSGLYAKERNHREQLQKEAMDAYVSKDVFLTNMSHEIRTPMNAIVGTVDLLLDQDISDHVLECVYNILNSCNALLSLTDEVMDISRSNSNEIVLYNSSYDIRELLMEIINMMAVRLMDSQVKMNVEIDENIPRNLYGDSQRLRQVYINILNNAIKYTKQGKITLRISGDYINDGEFLLKTEVEDTGVGIKSELMDSLFDRYKRVYEDDSSLGSVEGTGLGLAICKEILEKMDGTISVKSIYHEGSTFSFLVPQQIDGTERIAEVDAPNTYCVLVYDEDAEEREALRKIFEALNIYADIVTARLIFEDNILNNEYTHIFVSIKCYYDDLRFLERKLDKQKLVIISNINESVTLNKNGYVMTRPIHALNVASVLMNDESTYARKILRKGKFECPDATILVVDDTLTNLHVASGVLKKYNANVLTALSGKECLEMLEREKVDLIFLDYMMPEMNGIDTLIKIREMHNPSISQLPVIALTANVVNGAREMFLEAGFDDFISKPIEIDRIEKALRNFLPKELLVAKSDED